MAHRVHEGSLNAKGLKIAVVAGRFNSFITDRLLDGALAALARAGCDDPDVIRVPGAWEMPVVAAELARAGKHDAIVALGAVIRGDTPHFDYVAGEAAKGLANAASQHGVPVAFGVLTTNTLEQAIDRAGGKAGNKGADAAMTAVEMANLMRSLRGA